MLSMFLNDLLAQQAPAVTALDNLGSGRVKPPHTSSAGSAASLDFDNPCDDSCSLVSRVCGPQNQLPLDQASFVLLAQLGEGGFWKEVVGHGLVWPNYS